MDTFEVLHAGVMDGLNGLFRISKNAGWMFKLKFYTPHFCCIRKSSSLVLATLALYNVALHRKDFILHNQPETYTSSHF